MGLAGDNTEEEILDMSEYMPLYQTQGEYGVEPSEFGNITPVSTVDNKSTSQWLNGDVSFEYSTLQVEYLADNGQRTPTSGEDKTPSRNSAKMLMGSQT